jgi:DNA-binding GntR family transcriptional regulator
MITGSGGSSGPVPAPGASARLVAVDDAAGSARPATSVLADRMAAALVHREPGWRLPRRSALARRYNVSVAEVDAAIGELTRRSLIRRLPDGQLYRASPAEYLIPVEGIAGLSTRLDPMGSQIICQARNVSRRDAPRDVAWALGLPEDAAVHVVRCVWASGAGPAAISTAYLPEHLADVYSGADLPSLGGMLHAIPTASPVAVDVELSPPQPSVARSLRLTPGQPAITVTIRFDDHAGQNPAGLTIVILRPELFRVVIETTRSTSS